MRAKLGLLWPKPQDEVRPQTACCSGTLLHVRTAVKESFEKILYMSVTVVSSDKVLYFTLESNIKIYPFVGSDSFANKGFSCRYAVSRYAITP